MIGKLRDNCIADVLAPNMLKKVRIWIKALFRQQGAGYISFKKR
jgi:hypothetical protein